MRDFSLFTITKSPRSAFHKASLSWWYDDQLTERPRLSGDLIAIVISASQNVYVDGAKQTADVGNKGHLPPDTPGPR